MNAVAKPLPRPDQITDMELMFPSAYLKSCDLAGKDVALVISEVQVEDLTMRGGATRRRGTVAFDGTEKKLVLNRTNGELIAAALGTRNPREWIGKRIVLYQTKVQMGRDMVDAIRVRDKAPPARKPAPASAPGRQPGED